MITGHPVRDRTHAERDQHVVRRRAGCRQRYGLPHPPPHSRKSFCWRAGTKKRSSSCSSTSSGKGEGSGHGNGANVPYGAYQAFGDLTLQWKDTLSPWTHYRRVLNLETAVARTSWQRKGVVYTQEAWVSIPDNILAVRITSARKGGISFTAALSRKEHATVQANKGALEITGQLPNGGQPGLRFAGALQVKTTGGRQVAENGAIRVENADECLLLFSAATDYNMNDYTQNGADPLPLVRQTLQRSSASCLRAAFPGTTAGLSSSVQPLPFPPRCNSTGHRYPFHTGTPGLLLRTPAGPAAACAVLQLRALPADRIFPPRRPSSQFTGPLGAPNTKHPGTATTTSISTCK